MLPDNQALAELHMHLRGAIPIDYLESQLQRYNPFALIDTAPPRFQKLFHATANIKEYLDARLSNDSEIEAADLLTYQSFDDFLATYLFTGLFIRTPADFAGLIDGVCNSLDKQGIVYAEITVSPIEYLSQSFSAEELVMELQQGAVRSKVPVKWIMDPVRNLGPERCCALLLEILSCSESTFSGITLGGSEHLFPPEQFESLFKIARKSGLHTTCHAGEALGPDSIRTAIDLLEVERIGHGVRAVEDPELLVELARREIPLEVCISSNLQTGLYPILSAHPIRALFDADVPVTINTDDPTFFHTTLRDEYNQLYNIGFSENEIQQLIINSAQAAFLNAADTEHLITHRLNL